MNHKYIENKDHEILSPSLHPEAMQEPTSPQQIEESPPQRKKKSPQTEDRKIKEKRRVKKQKLDDFQKEFRRLSLILPT